MIQRDRGLVLRTWPLRETSRIVAVLTRGTGKVRLVARGVRGPRSRAASSLEPGNEIELVFDQKPGRDLGHLRESALVAGWLAGTPRLDAMAAGWACLELLDRVVPDGAPSGGLLDLATNVLETLHRCRRREEAVLAFYAFELALLAELGQAPDLGRCRVCGAEASGSMSLEVESAALLCGACRVPGSRALRLPAAAVSLLAALQVAAWQAVGRDTDGPDRRLAGLALHRLLLHHVDRYRYPRSLQLLKPAAGLDSDGHEAERALADLSGASCRDLDDTVVWGARVAEGGPPPDAADRF